MYILADTNAAYIASPTAVQSEGANFGLKPIGAGPFEITSNNPLVEQDLAAWPGYFDSKHRYLAGLKYLNVGTDSNVIYNDLATNAIQSWTAIGTSGAPNVLAEAANPSLHLTRGADLVYLFMPINTNKPPFNNPLAREALSYCMDRVSIAQDVQGGWANPTPILAGTSEQYYPGSGGSVKNKLAAANKLEPYQYNVAKGSALVQQLGGLSFQFNTTAGQTQVVATALQQQWAQCGINATQQVLVLIGQGVQRTMRRATTRSPCRSAVASSTRRSTCRCTRCRRQLTTSSSYQQRDGHQLTGRHATNLASNQTALQNIWSRVWGTEDKLAVNIPIISGPNLYFTNKCLKNVGFIEAGQIFRSAYFAC